MTYVDQFILMFYTSLDRITGSQVGVHLDLFGLRLPFVISPVTYVIA